MATPERSVLYINVLSEYYRYRYIVCVFAAVTHYASGRCTIHPSTPDSIHPIH